MGTYVPPTADVVEEKQPQISVQTVWAMWLGNAGSGLGVGVIVAILVNRAFGFTWVDTAIWSLCAAGLVFGLLMAVRFSLDEIVQAWEWRRALADIERLEEENAILRERVASLVQDLDYVNLQRSARAAVPPQPAAKVLPAATAAGPVRDAETLLQRNFAGDPWARDAMKRYAGWTSTRWAAARDVLAGAGVLVTRGQQSIIQPDTLSGALTQLRSRLGSGD